MMEQNSEAKALRRNKKKNYEFQLFEKQIQIQKLICEKNRLTSQLERIYDRLKVMEDQKIKQINQKLLKGAQNIKCLRQSLVISLVIIGIIFFLCYLSISDNNKIISQNQEQIKTLKFKLFSVELSLKKQLDPVYRAKQYQLEQLVLNKANERYGNIRQWNDLQRLLQLNLSNSKIKELPQRLMTLKNLKSLYLQNNKISFLDENICLMRNLRNLYLENNLLTALPSSIGYLTQLRYLYLKGNPIEVLPDIFNELKKLIAVSLDLNWVSGPRQLDIGLERIQVYIWYYNQLSRQVRLKLEHQAKKKKLELRFHKNLS